MPYLRWDSASKTPQPSKDKGMDIKEVLQAVKNTHRLLEDPCTTLRFHALVNLANNQDRSVPFRWLVSSRTNAEIWHELRRLCFHSTWQLIRAQIKPQGAERSALAKQVAQALGSAQLESSSTR